MITNNIQNITAIEQDGLNVRTITITCKILNHNIDLKQAIKHAVTQYLKTPDGQHTYEYNCGCFNYADFATNVPNEINKEHGFEIIEPTLSDIIVNWDENLADEFESEVE